jgi:hypothetical protein
MWEEAIMAQAILACVWWDRKTTHNLNQDSWSLGQDLNMGPPKYKAI